MRLDLTMCLITVISISFLCLVVADIDSAFNAFFTVDLDCFRRVMTRIDVVYADVASEERETNKGKTTSRSINGRGPTRTVSGFSSLPNTAEHV
jgi:hypothetical protein